MPSSEFINVLHLHELSTDLAVTRPYRHHAARVVRLVDVDAERIDGMVELDVDKVVPSGPGRLALLNVGLSPAASRTFQS